MQVAFAGWPMARCLKAIAPLHVKTPAGTLARTSLIAGNEGTAMIARTDSQHPWWACGLVVWGLATTTPASEAVPSIGVQHQHWFDHPFREDDPVDLTIRTDFRFTPDRQHKSRGATYDQQVWDAQAEGTILVTDFERIPIRLGGRMEGQYRDHRVRETVDVLPIWVESGTVNTLTGGDNTGTNTSTTTDSSQDLAAYTLLSDNTLPTSRMHTFTFGPGWSGGFRWSAGAAKRRTFNLQSIAQWHARFGLGI